VLRGLRAQGHTIFLASHDLADVEALCDRDAVMQAGSVRFIGTPQELKATYAASTIEDAFLACLAEHEPA
jgi:ABC-2 type transport system ATP-binding protein